MATTRTPVTASGAPAALGPYSQGIQAGNLLFCSGQVGLDPATGNLAEGIEAQTRQALANLAAVLAAGNSSLERVVKTTIFLAEMADFAAVNAIYGESFPSAPPARSTFQVAALPRNALIEIEMIALCD
jgi:2-iminobutanoate/2-iminopropanoate deaminase